MFWRELLTDFAAKGKIVEAKRERLGENWKITCCLLSEREAIR